MHKNYFSTWKSDIGAGFVVFLVALPLCLGIALASGAPIVAGLISAIIAGLVVSWLSGSELSVSGPAAGMSVVVASGIATLGSWSAFLLATVLAGLFQIIISRLRGGEIAAFFPNSVIKGMLAAIGLTLIFKQIPHAVGWDMDYEGDETFIERFGQSNTFLTMLESVGHHTPGAILVSVGAAICLVLWNTRLISQNSWLSKVPGSLVAVMSGVGVNQMVGVLAPRYFLDQDSGHLVHIPSFHSLNDFFGGIALPSLADLGRSEIWFVAATVAAVASIETLLSIEAVDRMDPYRRVSDGNRELMAQGVGNVLSGLLGGLVMTSVIVRSSANVYAGGKTRLSSFFHGFFMLAAIVFFARWINQIPLASLAVVLIFVGYKLISPAVVRSVWKLGSEQFVPFIVTITAVVLTDLLKGVAVGLGVAFLIIIRMNHHQAITVINDGDLWLVRFAKDVSFAHKSRLKKILAAIPETATVVIDGVGAKFIDLDILEEIGDFIEHAPKRGIRVSWKNLRSKRFSLRGRGDGELQEPSFGK